MLRRSVRLAPPRELGDPDIPSRTQRDGSRAAGVAIQSLGLTPSFMLKAITNYDQSVREELGGEHANDRRNMLRQESQPSVEKVTLDFSAMRQRLTGLYPAGVPKSLNTIVITRVPG